MDLSENERDIEREKTMEEEQTKLHEVTKGFFRENQSPVTGKWNGEEEEKEERVMIPQPASYSRSRFLSNFAFHFPFL